MNRRAFLRSTIAGGMLLPAGVGAVLPFRRPVLLSGGVNPWGTWSFASGLPSFFRHAGTWRVSSGVLVNEPTLGSELIKNGGFDSTTGWYIGSGWSVDGGILTGSSVVGDVYRGATIASERWYDNRLDLLSRTAGTVRFLMGGQTPAYLLQFSSPASIVNTVRTVASSSIYWYLYGPVFSGTADNASCKELTVPMLSNLAQLSTPNASISATVAALTTGTQAGLLVNYVDENNFCYVIFDGAGKIKAVQRVAGTYAADSLSSASAFSANDVLQAISSGGTVTVKKNGTTIGSPFALNAALVGGTQFGLFSTYVGNTISSCTIARA